MASNSNAHRHLCKNKVLGNFLNDSCLPQKQVEIMPFVKFYLKGDSNPNDKYVLSERAL